MNKSINLFEREMSFEFLGFDGILKGIFMFNVQFVHIICASYKKMYRCLVQIYYITC